ncbi:protein NYNRIN-like [Cricetulus griseus]|uniref:Protein NYNRIN-like n=1 Tax=Cricetulus griseus TaxID=10029 RepID=A0A9J7JAD0_CRIGR|nr:protein NYNRIN-like [Cricetulus griseus]
MAMLRASHLPKAIGIIHCRSHQTDSSVISRGNNRADRAARAAALRGPDLPHPPQGVHTLQPTSSQPPPNMRQILSYLHQLFHPNSKALSLFVKAHLKPTSEDLNFLKTITASCKTCQMSNPNSKYRNSPFPTHQARGSLPGTDWQLDFTHMPTVRRVKYLLVLVDTFSGWVEAFPTTNKKAQTVSNILLREIIPRFGIPASLQSDNGPEFTSQISQTLSKALNIPWHFHIPYHPQSSGKVERTNRSLKTVLVKMSQELHLDWVKLLPLALFRLRALPKQPLFISPFELMYGRPALTPGLSPKPSPLPDRLLTPLLHHLRSLLWEFADHSLPRPCATPCTSPINIGDQVLLSPPDQSPSPLSPKWKGPFKVILVTPTAAKLEGLPHWIHLSHLKPFTSPPETHPSYTVSTTGPCSLRFQRTLKSSTLPPISEE